MHVVKEPVFPQEKLTAYMAVRLIWQGEERCRKWPRKCTNIKHSHFTGLSHIKKKDVQSFERK